jgi:hypothetical protein
VLTFAIKMTPRGLQISQLTRQPSRLRGLARAALLRAVSEYCRGELPISILDRFGRRAVAIYPLRHRSAGYVKRQTRDIRLRGPAPFVSPRDVPAAKIAQALQGLASAKPGAAQLLAAGRVLTSSSSRPHLRDLITRPGTGHRILVSGGAKAKVTITYPAARALNANPQYGEELRDLSLANYRDWIAITNRARVIFGQLVAELQAGRPARGAA